MLSPAADHLARAHGHSELLGDPTAQPKMAWVEAVIHQGTGDPAAAEALLVAARQGYAEAEELSSLGIVSLVSWTTAPRRRTPDVGTTLQFAASRESLEVHHVRRTLRCSIVGTQGQLVSLSLWVT